jgi:nitrite reductase/ring-hydroxylating ferredoxin subunit
VTPDRWHRVELDSEGRAVVATEDGEVAVFRAEVGLFAVANACPHAGNPLIEGELVGEVLVCAFHGWRFDLATGACLVGETPVRCFATEERLDGVWVHLDEPAPFPDC